MSTRQDCCIFVLQGEFRYARKAGGAPVVVQSIVAHQQKIVAPHGEDAMQIFNEQAKSSKEKMEQLFDIGIDQILRDLKTMEKVN